MADDGDLNITNDPKMDEAKRKLEAAIHGVDIEDIKESASVRADVKSRLNTILKEYEW